MPFLHRLALLLLALPALLFAQAAQHLTPLGNFGKGEGEVEAVFATGSLVYFGVGNELRIASFADSSAPQTLARLTLSNNVNDIAGLEISEQQFLAIANGSQLALVNVDNPFDPTLYAAIAAGDNCEGVATQGTLAYVAASNKGLRIYDCANPTAMQTIAALDSLGYCESVALDSTRVYVAAGKSSYLIDVRNPRQPLVISSIAAQQTGYHQFVGVKGEHVYVCDYNLGVLVYRISTPQQPELVATISTGPQTARITFAGSFAYVANGEAGIHLLDVSTPAAPRIVSTFDTPGSAASLWFVPTAVPPPPPIEQEEIYNPSSLNYLLFMPRDTTARIEGKFPLILSLHGIGERGSDLQRVKRDGLPRMLDGNNAFPFIVISPQCPATTEWYYDRTDTLLRKLLDEALVRYPIDRRRIYVTGFSMGGIGAWDLGIRYPNRFAAIAPIAARGEEGWNVCAMVEVPVWAFHGANDTTVPLSAAQAIVQSLINCGGEVTFTVYPNVGHDAWTRTYGNPQLYQWLLSKSR